MTAAHRFRYVLYLPALLCALAGFARAQAEEATPSDSAREAVATEPTALDSSRLTLNQLKEAGAERSSYRNHHRPAVGTATPRPKLAAFRRDIEPVLKKSCLECHGPETQEGNIRIDTLDPDLLHGDDVNWWLEIVAVLSNGEMPPADGAALSDKDRSKIIDWLSSEIQVASAVRRAEQGDSSFRRLTRYEYNYALQDLLGLPYDFAKDLPPEAASEDGFHNSSEMLHMTVSQFETYRDLARSALNKATVQGERPKPIYWGVTMEAAAAELWAKYDAELAKINRQNKDDPEKLKREQDRLTARYRVSPNAAHYKNRTSGLATRALWSYGGARYAWKPTEKRPAVPPVSEQVAILPTGQKLIVELGDTVPDIGALRVRVRASRAAAEKQPVPSMQLEFGWQASNDSHASVRISERDLAIEAPADQPAFYQWEIPLCEIYPRNSVRERSKLGDLPSPSEYVRFVNSSVSRADIQIDYVEITAPVYDQWPPESHTRIFIASANQSDEPVYAREVLAHFLPRAWRRPVNEVEIDQKLALFGKFRPHCDNFQEAMIEVLATALSSPQFLYLVNTKPDRPQSHALTADELATRLSMFLWCSVPDDELRALAASGRLGDRDVLASQVKRMLADDRSRRFSEHYVRQWLDMQLLEFLNVDKNAYRQFDPPLKEAMQREPVAFFHEMLRQDHSLLDFIHADYTMANERLALHYGISNVAGNDFRRVELEPQHQRGGLLTQAGLLAMNSDGKDSHPLKRGIWMLECLLNDPPPPPPPAVPEIDLADPEILKLSLKERIENHRNHAACLSCHAKIDPWGIAFENFDAIGSWRTEANGKPVDATSLLFNRQKLAGMEGLKRYLLAHRQDQFARAMVHKMSTYALGRPLAFGDRAMVDQITAELRQQGDGLATMVRLIVTSDLFQSK